jgi:colicin import membrane protein
LTARIDAAKSKLEKTVSETKALEAKHKDDKPDSVKTLDKSKVEEKPAAKKE